MSKTRTPPLVLSVGTRKMPRHVIAKLPRPNFSKLGDDLEASDRFHEAMNGHLEDVVAIHNESCDWPPHSIEYLALRQRIRDAARFVVGDLIFERYSPGCVDQDMEDLIEQDSPEEGVVWASYFVVDSVDQFALDLRNTAEALEYYRLCLFEWWKQFDRLGNAAMNALNGGRSPLSH